MYYMKSHNLYIILTLIAVLAITGCSEQTETINNDIKAKWNIKTVSLLSSTKYLPPETCPELSFLFDKLSESQKQECRVNAKKRMDEDKSYYYEYNDATMITLRNLPERFRRHYHEGKTTFTISIKGLKDKRHPIATEVRRNNGKKYFFISEESDLDNPVILVSFYENYPVYFEITNPKNKYKKSFAEAHSDLIVEEVY